MSHSDTLAVGVIGTGSSAIQSIPIIAEQAAFERAQPQMFDMAELLEVA